MVLGIIILVLVLIDAVLDERDRRAYERAVAESLSRRMAADRTVQS